MNQLNNVVIDIESSRLYAILTHLINTNYYCAVYVLQKSISSVL